MRGCTFDHKCDLSMHMHLELQHLISGGGVQILVSTVCQISACLYKVDEHNFLTESLLHHFVKRHGCSSQIHFVRDYAMLIL